MATFTGGVILIAAVITLAVAGSPPSSYGSKPSIVFILADDLGYNNIGLHNHVTKSPHIDSLFTQGLKLNFSYSHKWCAPTRSAFMTGRMPYHTGIEHGSLGTYAAPEQYLALSQDWTFLPATLKAAGYRTHMLGKWHLGFWADRYTPTGRGFDSYLGYSSGDEQYFTHFKWPAYGGGAGCPAGYNTSLPSLFNITDFSNGTAALSSHVYDGMYSTYVYGDEAERIIRMESAQTDHPFFLYVAAQSIHTPLEAPQVYMDMYPNAPGAANHSDAQVIHAMVTALDDMVGVIYNALKTTGVWDNTLVIFTADNGGDTHGNNFPLRAGKFTTWEGGMRVVGAVNGGFLPSQCSGEVANGIIHIADWHPTFAHLAGVEINQTGPRPVDGLNVWSHIESCGVTPSARTELLHHYDGPNTGAFRVGDMKLIIGSMSPWCWDTNYPNEVGKTCKPGQGDPHDRDWSCTPCKNQGPNPCSSDAPCLFNISQDPLEHDDVSKQFPQLVTTMRARYDQLGNDSCTPSIESKCLDYMNHDDQVTWVKNVLSSMRIAPVPNAGQPLRPPPPTPPPPPPPPITPSVLNGNYSMSDNNDHDISLVVLAGGNISFTSHVQKTCWRSGVGTISDDGRHFSVNATGEGASACLRFGVGTVTDATTRIQIDWQCFKPPDHESCSWPSWVKVGN